MGLSSLYLDAFFAAARSLNFSQAARELHITQSALSQRIKGLEEELDLTLFVRQARGVALTDPGARLLRYCHARYAMEQELLDQLNGAASRKGLGGVLQIAGYSSIVRSVLLPALAPFLRANRHIQVHVRTARTHELADLLLTGQVDLAVSDSPMHRADVETHELGLEECILVQSAGQAADDPVVLDYDPDDTTTARFFALQPGPAPEHRRCFLDDIYAIIDAVALGLGKAVIARHLIAHDRRLRVVEGHQSLRVPVLLHHHKQPFYTALQQAAIAELKERVPMLLAAETRLLSPT